MGTKLERIKSVGRVIVGAAVFLVLATVLMVFGGMFKEDWLE